MKVRDIDYEDIGTKFHHVHDITELVGLIVDTTEVGSCADVVKLVLKTACGKVYIVVSEDWEEPEYDERVMLSRTAAPLLKGLPLTSVELHKTRAYSPSWEDRVELLMTTEESCAEFSWLLHKSSGLCLMRLEDD